MQLTPAGACLVVLPTENRTGELVRVGKKSELAPREAKYSLGADSSTTSLIGGPSQKGELLTMRMQDGETSLADE